MTLELEDLSGLSTDEVRFVQLYVEHDDKRAAAKAMWPDDIKALYRATVMMRNHRVRMALNRVRSAALDEIAISKGRILRELEHLAFYNPQDYVDENGDYMRMHELPEYAARALGDMEYVTMEDGRVVPSKLKTSKLEALKVLAKAAGLLDKDGDRLPAVFHFDLSMTPDPAPQKAVVRAGGRVIDIQATPDG